jgi:hypothetical protein
MYPLRNKLGLICAAMLVAGGSSAWAQGSMVNSPATRAEVKAESKAAQRAGDMQQGEAGVTKDRPHGGASKNEKMGGKSRAEVKAGAADGPMGEAGTTKTSPRGGPKMASGEKTRQEVKAEAARAKKAGEIPQGEGNVVTKKL